MSTKEKILWSVFGLYLVLQLIIVLFYSHLIGPDIERSILLTAIAFVPPVILLILHSSWTLSYARAALFIFLAMAIGWISEYIGVNWGVLFGGQYLYNLSGSRLLGIPWLVIIYWAAFIYTGYCITNAFIYWSNKDKPQQINHDLGRIIPLVILDGFLVLGIDLIMDPIQVKIGSWTWLDGGMYFGVPIGNFIGWFLVAAVVTTVFRLFEYYWPRQDTLSKNVLIMPVIGYGLLNLSFSMTAWNYGMNNLAIIGLFLALPLTLYNLYLFIRWREDQSLSSVK